MAVFGVTAAGRLLGAAEGLLRLLRTPRTPRTPRTLDRGAYGTPERPAMEWQHLRNAEARRNTIERHGRL
jgi:hypothetical protein